MKYFWLLAICFLTLNFYVPSVYAEPIPITLSHSMDQVVFDGKWSFMQEWKASSLTEIRTESGIIYLRTAHQENFIYVMIDAVFDNSLDKEHDQVIVCFDSKSEHSVIPDDNDFCFQIKLGEAIPVTLKGSELSEKFETIDNHPELIAIGGISDENDRYSKIPHTSYEFRIPIDLLGRTDSYGFYVGIYEHSNSTMYTWPSNLSVTSKNVIPDPIEWGIIFSPDKSLPEYNLPMLVLTIGVLSTILIGNKIVNLKIRF